MQIILGFGVADSLTEAKKLIERGWCRGEFQRGQSFCTVGAIRKVTNQFPVREDCYRLLALTIGTTVGWPSEVAHWNDKQPSKKPVLAAFDRAIALAREATDA